ncbi:hypothetical protein T4E_2940, partial [Trichinella pseudospiralis]
LRAAGVTAGAFLVESAQRRTEVSVAGVNHAKASERRENEAFKAGMALSPTVSEIAMEEDNEVVQVHVISKSTISFA